MFLFPLHPNRNWAKKLALKSGLKLGRLNIKQFADREYYIQVLEKIKNKKVFVLAETLPPADNILKTLILINALKSNKAKKIHLIIPYFGYGKQDKIDRPGAPISAKLMANIYKTAGANKIICLDLHSPLVQRFIGPNLVHINLVPLVAKYFKKLNIKNLAVVSPDAGGVKRAKEFAKLIGLKKIAKGKKFRPEHDVAKIVKIKGQVKDKNIVIVDDFVQSGGTLIAAAHALKKNGAKNIYVALTHGILTPLAVSRLNKSPIKQIFQTDTISLGLAEKMKKATIVSIIPLLSSYLKLFK